LPSLQEAVFGYDLFWAALALLLSHGVSFFYNFIWGGEYLRTTLKDATQEPYARMVVLHLTIIFGAMLITAVGSPVAGLVVLIILKTIIDIGAHLRQHKKYSGQTT
jgi:hypothetical protein